MTDDAVFNELRFEKAKDEYLNSEHKRYNIGTYSEGTLHMILKYFMCPDMKYHEVPLCGYIADIFNDGEVTEIQTGAFGNLVKKLDAYLPEYKVNVVYPVAYVKRICKIDKQTGDVSKPRKSPKKGRIQEILPELFYIRDKLGYDNLTVYVCMLEITEYRYDNPKRKGRTIRYDRVPTSFVSLMTLNVGDYSKLVPAELGDEFTSKEFAKASGLCGMRLSAALKTLCACGAISIKGKKGRAYIYGIDDQI